MDGWYSGMILIFLSSATLSGTVTALITHCTIISVDLSKDYYTVAVLHVLATYFSFHRLMNYVECVKQNISITPWTADITSTSSYTNVKDIILLLSRAFDVSIA